MRKPTITALTGMLATGALTAPGTGAAQPSDACIAAMQTLAVVARTYEQTHQDFVAKSARHDALHGKATRTSAEEAELGALRSQIAGLDAAEQSYRGDLVKESRAVSASCSWTE